MSSPARPNGEAVSSTSRLPDLSDAEAVRAVIRGDREMFEIIVRRHNTQLYRVGLAYLRDHALTEDAMQNTYLKAFQNLAKFQGSSAFATWLTRIMINECLMLLRRASRMKMDTLVSGHVESTESAAVAPVAQSSLHQEDVRSVLEAAIQRLPRQHRAVYVLREIQRLSTAETARSLGLSRANVKVSLHRARNDLKSQLLQSAAGVELFDYPAGCCDPMTVRVMRAVRAMSPGAAAERSLRISAP